MTKDEISTMRKVAREARLIATSPIPAFKIIMWAEDNGTLIADALEALCDQALSGKDT